MTSALIQIPEARMLVLVFTTMPTMRKLGLPCSLPALMPHDFLERKEVCFYKETRKGLESY